MPRLIKVNDLEVLVLPGEIDDSEFVVLHWERYKESEWVDESSVMRLRSHKHERAKHKSTFKLDKEPAAFPMDGLHLFQLKPQTQWMD